MYFDNRDPDCTRHIYTNYLASTLLSWYHSNTPRRISTPDSYSRLRYETSYSRVIIILARVFISTPMHTSWHDWWQRCWHLFGLVADGVTWNQSTLSDKWTLSSFLPDFQVPVLSRVAKVPHLSSSCIDLDSGRRRRRRRRRCLWPTLEWYTNRDSIIPKHIF